MPNFTRLPLLIANEIIKFALPKPYEIKSKSTINILHICSSWRRIAVNYYYKMGYYYGSKCDDDKVKPDTNIDLITSTGCIKYTKNVRLRFYNANQLVQFLDQYPHLLQAEEKDWRKLVQFEVFYLHPFSIPSQAEHNDQIVNVYDKFVEFANYITTYFPTIKSLHLLYQDITRTANSATEIFLNSYSRQLTNLSGNYVSCFHNDYVFDNLTNLDLYLNPEALKVLPRINYSKIVSLFLATIPYTFKWNDLFTDTDINEITFYKLRILVLNFSRDYTENELDEYISSQQLIDSKYKIKVNFPELAEISLGSSPSWPVSRKTKYCFSSKLKHISTHNLYDIHGMLDNIDCKNLQFCEVFYIDWNNTHVKNIYNLTNELFSAKSCYKYDRSRLRLMTDDYSIDWNKTKWISLKKIIFQSCNVGTFVSVQKHCPQLISFHILKLVVEMPLDKAEELFKSELKENYLAEKSRMEICKLQNVSILEFNSQVIETQDFATFVKVYLKYSKYLMYLSVDKGEWMNIEEFIVSLEKYYSHLSNIVVNYDYASHAFY